MAALRRSILILSVAALAATLTLIVAMTSFQDDLLFPVNSVPEAGPLPAGTERLRIQSADRTFLHGVKIPPASERGGKKRTLILAFGGNGWNAEDAAAYVHDLYPEAWVVAFHYRGYRPSEGRPSADALIADAPLVFDAAVDEVRPDRVVAVGLSIGSGIAASLTNSRPVDALILVTPFDSLKSVAQSMFPWLPIGPLFAHEIDTAAYLENSEVPIAIIAGGLDEIVLPKRTQALRSRLKPVAFDRTIDRAGHNDIYGRQEFRQAMQEGFSLLTR